MGYFDASTAMLYRSDGNGRRVIVPFGAFGGVYLVHDLDAERIRLMVRTWHKVILCMFGATQVVLGWRWSVFLVGPISLVAYFVRLALIVRPLVS